MARAEDKEAHHKYVRNWATEKKYDEAIRSLDSLQQEKGNDAVVTSIITLYEKASLLKAKGSMKDALEIYKKLTTLDPKGTAWFEAGNILGDMKWPNEALLYYERYLHLYSTDPNGWTNLGLTYSELEDDQKAIEYYDKVRHLTLIPHLF